jgi:hypothetical protein
MDVPEEEAAPVGGELTLLRVGARHPATGGSYCFIYMSLSPTGPDIQDFPPLGEDISASLSYWSRPSLLLVQISKTLSLIGPCHPPTGKNI